jgi:hypothetical protein
MHLLSTATAKHHWCIHSSVTNTITKYTIETTYIQWLGCQPCRCFQHWKLRLICTLLSYLRLSDKLGPIPLKFLMYCLFIILFSQSSCFFLQNITSSLCSQTPSICVLCHFGVINRASFGYKTVRSKYKKFWKEPTTPILLPVPRAIWQD